MGLLIVTTPSKSPKFCPSWAAAPRVEAFQSNFVAKSRGKAPGSWSGVQRCGESWWTVRVTGRSMGVDMRWICGLIGVDHGQKIDFGSLMSWVVNHIPLMVTMKIIGFLWSCEHRKVAFVWYRSWPKCIFWVLTVLTCFLEGFGCLNSPLHFTKGWYMYFEWG